MMDRKPIVKNQPLINTLREKSESSFDPYVTLYRYRNHETPEEAMADHQFNYYSFHCTYNKVAYMRTEHLDRFPSYYSVYAVQSNFSTN